MGEVRTRSRLDAELAAEDELCTTLSTVLSRSDRVLSQGEVDQLLGVLDHPV